MRYVLGIKIYDKEKTTTKEGLAVFDALGGYPSIREIESIEDKINNEKEILTFVYNNIKEAEKAVKKYSLNFRRDDVWKDSQKWDKSKTIITFYPIKIDNNKFPFCVKESEHKTKDGRIAFAYTKKNRKEEVV